MSVSGFPYELGTPYDLGSLLEHILVIQGIEVIVVTLFCSSSVWGHLQYTVATILTGYCWCTLLTTVGKTGHC
jgi:hypothetical protein